MDPRFAFEVEGTLCVQITVVIAATFALQRWIVDARSGCRLWTACFVCVIGLVIAAFLLPHRRLFDFPDALLGERSRESMLGLVTWQARIAIALGAAWGIGVGISLLRRAFLCVGLLRYLKHDCVQLDAEALLERINIDHQDQSDLSILASDKIQGPFCWQLHRPVIVLPTFLLNDDGDDEASLRHVLLHEIEHLRTQHPMQHFLQGVCSTIFWFHPMVWMAGRDAELTREFLCDEVAARTVGKFGAYLRTLAEVAERCGSVSCTDVPKGTLAFGNQASALIRRSNRLVELASSQSTPSRWRPSVAMFALLLCAVLVQQVWLPTNAMASQRSDWSPWPAWTAETLNEFGIHVRDFELFEDRVQMHELLYEED